MSVKDYLKPKDVDAEKCRLLSMADENNKFTIVIKWIDPRYLGERWSIATKFNYPIPYYDAVNIRINMLKSISSTYSYYNTSMEIVMWDEYIRKMVKQQNIIR